MKRLLILLLVALLAISGCSKKPEEDYTSIREREEEAIKAEEAKKEEERLKAEKEAEEKRKKEEEEAKRLEELKKMVKSPLSGLPTEKDKINRRIFGVMIDNHVDARPQSGIGQAEIVYEMEVESDITRYMALYLANEPEDIGPIRSLRPCFINAILEYDGVIVRYGGSDDADYQVADYGIDQVDGMQVDGSYIRRDGSKGKVAPHNAYTTSNDVRQAIADYGYNNNPGTSVFTFNDEDTDISGEEANKISLDFWGSDSVMYKYDQATKTYLRFVSGSPHVEESDKKQIAPKNIIIQFAYMGFYDDGVHRTIDLIGEGEGKFITNGKVMDITWSKESLREKTVFKAQDGTPIKLNPGQTWVEVFNINKSWNIQ